MSVVGANNAKPENTKRFFAESEDVKAKPSGRSPPIRYLRARYRSPESVVSELPWFEVDHCCDVVPAHQKNSDTLTPLACSKSRRSEVPLTVEEEDPLSTPATSICRYNDDVESVHFTCSNADKSVADNIRNAVEDRNNNSDHVKAVAIVAGAMGVFFLVTSGLLLGLLLSASSNSNGNRAIEQTPRTPTILGEWVPLAMVDSFAPTTSPSSAATTSPP